MPRPKNPTPQYVPHKASGRARFVWTDPAGNRHDKLLPGKYGSEESRAAFARTMLEMSASPGAAARESKPAAALSLNELLIRYVAFATMHYPKTRDGKPSSALVEAKLTVRAIRTLYGDAPATEFGPLKLRAVLQGWVGEGLSRASCNKRLGIAKRIFKWAVSEELIPPSVFQALDTVPGLAKGRTAAKETEPVGPVDDAAVDATLAHLNRHLRALVEVQRLTGMRPGEVTRLRVCEIDRAGEVWFYRPKAHKNEHRGKPRAVAIGKRAQEIINGFKTDDPNEYLFSPRKAMAEHFAARRAARTTKKFPSEVKKLAAAKKNHRYSDHYTTVRYGIAIARAAEKAGVEHWHPNQLRHSFATKVRKAHGLEAAQVALGHAQANVTQIYAERDESLAAAIAAKIG